MHEDSTMKFGIFDQIDDSGRPLNVQYEQRMQLAELYDRTGFHCFHQSEHHATTLSMAPAQSVFLAAMAQRTRRLKLCPLVYLLPIHHPIRLAEEICMLDHLSNGRLEFGIGRGASPHEIEALGVASDLAGAAYAESYEILQKYFSSETVNHEGRFWNVKDFPVTLKPLQKPQPPMWYAAASPDSVVWPARNGVHVICGGPVNRVHTISERYRAEAAQAGAAARTDALIGIWRFVVVAETDEKAQALAEQAWPRFHESFYRLWRQHGTEPQRLKLAADYPGMIASGHGFAGSPATVAQALLQQLRDGSLNYFAGQFMFGDMPHEAAMDSVGLFASQVMPALREASRDWLTPPTTDERQLLSADPAAH
jgi:alkanesulfonate monooxygenase SsuD/methylene tetrahydromethanopterin reductase-like flavin-dependent oxidoreductase (luciferase family)